MQLHLFILLLVYLVIIEMLHNLTKRESYADKYSLIIIMNFKNNSITAFEDINIPM